MIRTASFVALGLPLLAGLAFGTRAVLPAILGAVGAIVVQLLAWRVYLRAMPSKGPSEDPERAGAAVIDWNERALRALGAAAAIRLFGGVVVVAAVLIMRVAEPLAFTVSFALGYGALEISVGRWLIANERGLDAVDAAKRPES